MSTKPWNMQPGETAKAYQAFEVYRDLGAERSLEKAYRQLTTGSPLEVLKQWSSRHDWQARVRAFDEYVAARAADKAVETAASVRARQAQHAKAIQFRAMQKFATVTPEGMSVGEATRAWQVGAEVERKALGIDEKVFVLRRDEVDPEEAARLIEELRRLEAIEGTSRLLESYD
ncbi:MAG: hypothetical protein KBF47_13930 [Gemmatimonadales bacterium]|nr:hypothetical protein [Gemmatimonadales bacterium]